MIQRWYFFLPSYEVWKPKTPLSLALALPTLNLAKLFSNAGAGAIIFLTGRQNRFVEPPLCVEQLRYRNCFSTRHGLVSVGGRFIASSQSRGTTTAAIAPIFFWSWDKPKVVARSFPYEPIGPLVSNSEGTYIIGGRSSGDIFFWELSNLMPYSLWSAGSF